MMGVEKGSKKGVDVHNLNNALHGHLPDGYKVKANVLILHNDIKMYYYF